METLTIEKKQEKKQLDELLPDTLHELLRTALLDLEKCEVEPEYEIDMSFWYSVDLHGKCLVCLAGTMLAQTCELGSKELLLEPFQNTRLKNKLQAVDRIKSGVVVGAYRVLYGHERLKLNHLNRYIIPYNDDPTGFKEQLWKLYWRLKDLEV